MRSFFKSDNKVIYVPCNGGDSGYPVYSGPTVVTPSDENIILPTEDTIVTSDITVLGDADLQPENIKYGVDIFGKVGTLLTPSLSTLNATANGTYSAAANSAWDEVEVNVEGATLSTLSVSANGVYNAPSGEGYDEVDVNVPNSYSVADEGKVVDNGALVAQTTRNVTTNGTYDTTLNDSTVVAVPVPTLTSETFTQNGTYTAPSGTAYDEVTVNVSGGGGFSIDDIAMKTLSGTIAGNATSIASSAFLSFSRITGASFPRATRIYGYGFAYCSSLQTISFPSCSYLGGSAFFCCSSLQSVSFPKGPDAATCAFSSCRSLSTALFSSTANKFVYASAFAGCWNLLSLYLFGWFSLSNVNAFASTPISNYTASTGGVNGSIFVPSSLYASYISATNWATYSARIVSLTDAQVQNVMQYGTHNP